MAVEVEVFPDTGRSRLVRAASAVDAGQVVNPDGLTNQIEGAIGSQRVGRFSEGSASTARALTRLAGAD